MIVPSKKRAVVVDLDGTISSSLWREPLIGDPEDWVRFHEHLTLDSPIPEVVGEVRAARWDGATVVVLTARGEDVRGATSWWLAENRIPCDMLLMRDRFEERAPALKRRLLETHVLPSYEVTRCFEDHLGVIDVWTGLGLDVRVCSDPRLPPAIQQWEEYLAAVLAAGPDWRRVSVEDFSVI